MTRYKERQPARCHVRLHPTPLPTMRLRFSMLVVFSRTVKYRTAPSHTPEPTRTDTRLNQQLAQESKQEVDFVLSDISPHLSAWTAASKKSSNLHYISTSVDASAAPVKEKLLEEVTDTNNRGVMRLFSLAFHHFDDDLAKRILKNTIETSDGFW